MEARERELYELLEPQVATLGASLVEIGLGSARRGTVVRLVIHSAEGVTHGDCARVTRACDNAIEAAEALAGSYTLEVSSPGLSRVLRSGKEFEVFRGLPVRVRLADEAGERTGVCAGTDGEAVVLQDREGNRSVIPWSSVTRARLAVEPGGLGGKGR